MTPIPRLTTFIAALLSLGGPALAATSPLPAGLAGSWLFGSLGTLGYRDTLTGEWQNASSSGELVTIHADGRYERTRLLTMTTFSCTSKLFITEQGRVLVKGSQLTYQPSEGVNQGYSCSPANAWKTTKINPESFRVALGTDAAGQPQLTLSSQKATFQYRRYQP